MRATFLPAVVPAFALILVLQTGSAEARIWTVAPDGSGDAATIQAAVDSCDNGDAVELLDGIFIGEGNRDIDYLGKTIAIRSASGNAASCIVDCGGTEAEPHRGFSFGSAAKGAASLSGITITGGYFSEEPCGGAVLCEGGSAPLIDGVAFEGNRGSAVSCIDQSAPVLEDCVFRGNAGTKGGGLRTEWSSPSVRRCSFLENTAELDGGAVFEHSGRPVFVECAFVGNSSQWGGAIGLWPNTISRYVDCLFLDNDAEAGGGISALMCSTFVEGCVFAGNQSRTFTGGAYSTGKTSYTRISGCTFFGNGGPAGTLLCGEYGTDFTNTIIAGGTEGPAIHVDGYVRLTCCDLHGNAGGDWVGGLASQAEVNGNFSFDPLFCDAASGDFTLRSDSPCLPGNHPDGAACGLIGAEGEGCSVPTGVPSPSAGGVESSTWSAIKTRFR
jgi:hypothetical protein